MSTLQEQTAELRFRTGRLEMALERFMEQTTTSLRSIEYAIRELKEEAARDREEAARARQEDRQEAARVREEDRQEAARAREEGRQEADRAREKDRQEAARAREEDRQEAARAREEDRQEADRVWEKDRQEAARAREEDRQEAARAREEDRQEAARVREEDRQEAARAREEDRQEAARYREEADRAREEDRQEAARDRKEMNRRWGELANRMGTVVQDITAPSLRRIAREELGCGEEIAFTTTTSRVRSDDRHYRREFDALYVGSQAVLLNETKSTALSEYATAFVQFLKSGEFALYFPEHRELPVVPVFSSLKLPANVVTYLTKNGIYAVAMGESTMQVLNADAVRKKRTPPSPDGRNVS